MSNPFGDFDEEDKVRTSQTGGRKQANTHQSTTTSNPFGDFEDERDSPPFRPDNSQKNITTKKTPLRNNLLGTLEPSLSSSRQSLSSTDMETLSFTSSTSGINQWSVGDGQLEKEGLLCPNCLVEFKTITELMQHSEKCFASAGESSAAVGLGTSPNLASDIPGQMGVQIKDFFNKIRKSGRPTGPMTANQAETLDQTQEQKANEDFTESIFNPFKNWKEQMKIGPRRSHMEGFRKIRETRIERYVFETNKLLIRLDKLLRDYPPINDPVKRREHEQSVVTWIDESIVSLCPTCASKFNILTRKKHHCRLCGAVMCTKCSEFIDFEYARQLITPVGLDGTQHHRSSKPRASSISSINSSNLSIMSTSSSPNIGRVLLSVVSPVSADAAEAADKIRVCLNCMGLLANHKEKLEIAYAKPPIVQLYAELKEKLDEIKRLLPILLNMAESLNSGETTYSLSDANDLKKKLTRLGETSDLMSRKIEALGFTKGTPTADDPKPAPIPPPMRQYNLQLAIRRSTIAFIRNALLGLPELPDDKQFAELKTRNDEMIKRRIAYEKEMVLKEQQLYRERGDRAVIGSTDLLDKYSNSNATSFALSKSNKSSHSNAIISLDDGFCPQTSSTDLWRQMNEEERAQIMDEKTDPLAQQISIIRTYIRTARENHRYEEVAMLEENLKELEIEYYFKQEQQQPASKSFKQSPANSTNRLPENEHKNPFGSFDENS